MQSLGRKVNQIIEEDNPELELQTPLNPQIQQFINRYSNDWRTQLNPDNPLYVDYNEQGN